MRKPRRFNLPPIYIDERRERLAEIESRARNNIIGEQKTDAGDDGVGKKNAPTIKFAKPQRVDYTVTLWRNLVPLLLLGTFIWIVIRLLL